MVAAKLLDAARAIKLMATSRRSDLEQGSKAFFPDRPLFGTPNTRRTARRIISRTLNSPQAFLVCVFFFCAYIILASNHAMGPDGLDSLLPQSGGAFGLRDPTYIGPASTLVVYDYQGLDEEDADNLRFFLALGVAADDGNRYLIIAKEQLENKPDDGFALDAFDTPSPDPDDQQVQLPPLHGLPPNVEIVLRPNEPCRSAWGVLGWALQSGVIPDPSVYQNFILMDSSVRGPFLPAHWPPLVHWSAALLARLQGSVHMAGATISTDPTPTGPGAPPAAQPRPQPKIRPGLIAFDQMALEAIKSDPEVFRCRATVEDAMWFNEAGATSAVLHSGLNLDCLMLRFQKKDWLDKSSWGWKESNSEVDSGPFQVMFVPLRTKTMSTSRAAKAAHQYSVWAIKALRGSGEHEGGSKSTSKTPAVKKATATDTATARMHLDAAAAQAAAMAIRLEREKRAAQLQEQQQRGTIGGGTGIDTAVDSWKIPSDDGDDAAPEEDVERAPQLNLDGDLDNSYEGDIEWRNLDSGADDEGSDDSGTGQNVLADFESGTGAPTIDLDDDDDDGNHAPVDISDEDEDFGHFGAVEVDHPPVTDSDDYSGADDFQSKAFGGADGASQEQNAADNDYHHHAQELDQNPFGDDADAVGVAKRR